MVISHRHRFVFIKTRKTAGTSVEIVLSSLAEADAVVTPTTPPEPDHHPRNWRRRFNPVPELAWVLRGDGPVPRKQGLLRLARDERDGRAFYSHISLDLVRLREGARIAGYRTFCFERNSWDKVVSFYCWQRGNMRAKNRPHPSFEEWVAAGRLPTDWHLYARGERVLVDTVGRYETLSADLTRILGSLGLPTDVALPSAKASSRPKELDFDRGPAASAAIERVFAREIAHFEYRRPDWW
ncbi:MAG TPA: hypothetical protein VMZ28_11915 [Kofleriaceae bacterium]|nr:hypothetical protein [Kofleriaceae bacterium]